MRSATLVIITGLAVAVGALGTGECGDGDGWTRVGHGAPVRLAPGVSEASEAPVPGAAAYAVLDESTGAPVRSGTLSWLVAGAPSELTEVSWSSENGHLDLPCLGGETFIVAAPGYAPRTAVTVIDGRRHSLLLTPRGDLKLSLRPATAARLWLARQDRINVTHLFSNVAEPHDSDAEGRIEVRDLDRDASYVGVVTADGRAPFVGSFQELPLEHALSLEEGLGVSGAVRDERGQPIAGARVEAMGEIAALDNFRYRQAGTAGGDGSFRLGGLLAGTVRVRACAPGRACAEVAAELNEEAAAPAIALELPPGRDLVLTVENEAGEAVADATVYLQDRLHRTDARGRLELPGLPLGAAIPLKIFGRGFGLWEGELATERSRVTIVVPGGAAIERQVLSARRFAAGEVKVRWQAYTTEGRETSSGAGSWDPEQGVASAAGLPAGTYSLAVRLPGSATLVSERVELAVGERLVLPAAVPERGLAIAGRVLDGETLQPLAGARVSCEPGSPEVFRAPDVVEDVPSVLSDADGMFLLEGLDAGSCRAVVRAAGFAPWRRDGVEPDEAGLDIGDVELDRGMTVVGRVTERGERAITGAVVEITEAAAYAYYPEATVRSDHDGYFRAERLPVGRWTVTARHADRKARETVDGRAGETVELDLRLGGIRIEGEVWLGDSRAAGGTLVLTTDGAQAAGVVVMMQRLTADRQIFGIDREPIQLAVAGDGRFAGAGLEAGRYYASYTPPVAGAAPVTRSLDVPMVESFQCAIRYADAAVEGVVIDSDGEPVAGASVVASAGSGIQELSSFTDAEGRFAMQGLEAGRLVLTASHTEYAASSPTELDLGAGDAEGPVVLELGPPEGANIVLAVHTAAGSAGGAPVYLVGPETATGFTDTGGLATFAGVAAGSYRPCGIAYGGATGCGAGLSVDRGEQLQARLELGRGGWVDIVLEAGDGAAADVAKRAGSEPAKRMPQVRVMTADGVDLSGLLFMASPPQPTAGGLRIGPLQADEYLISVAGPAGSLQGRVRVVDGQPAELDLR
jgi:protocatechuate 3,4-dioxygenase beta subunit